MVNFIFLCVHRLYTGIHALKPKPKFKTGAISESTTALNVDQSNTSTVNADQKSSAAAATTPLASALAPKGVNAQDQPPAAAPFGENGAGASAAAVSSTQRKEVGLAKVQADKKKKDARKKSLKRL